MIANAQIQNLSKRKDISILGDVNKSFGIPYQFIDSELLGDEDEIGRFIFYWFDGEFLVIKANMPNL